jgi:hypothetical protein
MHDAALGGKVMAAVKPLVAQPRSRTIGGGGHRATTGFAANDLDVKMIDRHRDQIIYTARRTSERRISAPSLEKFSGGITPSQTVPATLQHYAQGSTIIPSSTLLENVMRKPRDFEGELKALQDKRATSRAARCSSSANWSSPPGQIASTSTNWQAR